MTTTYKINRKRTNNDDPKAIKQILANYEKAAKALQEAKKDLEAVHSDWRNLGSSEAGYYADQIGELLSCDNGEAGMLTMLPILKAKMAELEKMTAHR